MVALSKESIKMLVGNRVSVGLSRTIITTCSLLNSHLRQWVNYIRMAVSPLRRGLINIYGFVLGGKSYLQGWDTAHTPTELCVDNNVSLRHVLSHYYRVRQVEPCHRLGEVARRFTWATRKIIATKTLAPSRINLSGFGFTWTIKQTVTATYGPAHFWFLNSKVPLHLWT